MHAYGFCMNVCIHAYPFCALLFLSPLHFLLSIHLSFLSSILLSYLLMFSFSTVPLKFLSLSTYLSPYIIYLCFCVPLSLYRFPNQLLYFISLLFLASRFVSNDDSGDDDFGPTPLPQPKDYADGKKVKKHSP